MYSIAVIHKEAAAIFGIILKAAKKKVELFVILQKTAQGEVRADARGLLTSFGQHSLVLTMETAGKLRSFHLHHTFTSTFIQSSEILQFISARL